MVNLSPADEQFLEKLNRIIQARMTDSQFGVSELAREMGMSRSNLHRKVSKLIGKPMNNLISETRLNFAMKLLKEGTRNVSEVAYEVGFGSVPYFGKSFHDYFGFTPGEAMSRDVPENVQEGIQNLQIIDGNQKKEDKKHNL